MKNSIRLSLLTFFCVLNLAACSDSAQDQQYPKDQTDVRRDSRGKLTGDSGLFSFGGAPEEEKASKASPLGVNGFLWRATLDTLSFMPLASADPFGGTILTDWYEDPKTPGERYKVNALILDRTLRADGIRVSVFRQKLEGPTWRDLPSDEALNRKMEDTILTRARQMRIAQLGH